VQKVSFFAEAKPQLTITVGDFDPDPMLLGLPGGEVLELRTGLRRAATPSDLISRTLPIAPEGRCERWLQYLEQAHPNDLELIAYLQRWAGYCLTASVKEDMILFFDWGWGVRQRNVCRAYPKASWRVLRINPHRNVA